jgi:hypothetical protein
LSSKVSIKSAFHTVDRGLPSAHGFYAEWLVPIRKDRQRKMLPARHNPGVGIIFAAGKLRQVALAESLRRHDLPLSF